MFWIALAFYFLLYGLEPRYWAPYGLTWHSIPLTALFLNGYSPEIINALVPGGWSIAVEVNFYLLLPALLAVAHSLPRSITLTILAIAVSAVANRLFGVIFSNTGPDNRYVIDNFLFWNFFNQFPVFATGITAYFILSNPKLSRSAAAISAVILGGSIVVLGAFRGEAISYLTNHLMLTVVLFAMTTITLYQFPIKPLVNRPLQFLGKVSFSLYLVHFAILFYLDKYGVKSMFHPGDLSSLMYSAIVLMCASLVAFAFYSCVEKPCVRLGTMVIRHLESHNTSKGIKEAIARSGR